MKTWSRRSGAGVAALLAVAVVALAVAVLLGERKRDRHVAVVVAPVAYRDDAAGIERGGYLFRSRGCAECHGAAGAGHVLIDDDAGMLVRAPNITPAAGSVVAAYTPSDWVRTIRHGVKTTTGSPMPTSPPSSPTCVNCRTLRARAGSSGSRCRSRCSTPSA
jgi:mono/diheme cytochrome c family protein